MAKQFDSISPKVQNFIAQQHIFFLGTAGIDGRVNVSPKGMDSLRVLNDKRVIWLNLTGSGNETAAHLLEVNRMTIMFCSFETSPMILRLYGRAKCYHPNAPEWADLDQHFPDFEGKRQIFDMDIDLVQTSCGYAVPFYEFKEERTQLKQWTAFKLKKEGQTGIQKYWEEKNRLSIDGKPTGLPPKQEK